MNHCSNALCLKRTHSCHDLPRARATAADVLNVFSYVKVATVFCQHRPYPLSLTLACYANLLKIAYTLLSLAFWWQREQSAFRVVVLLCLASVQEENPITGKIPGRYVTECFISWWVAKLHNHIYLHFKSNLEFKVLKTRPI